MLKELKNYCTVNEFVKKHKNRKEGTFTPGQIWAMRSARKNKEYREKAFVKIGTTVLVNEEEFLRIRKKEEINILKWRANRERQDKDRAKIMELRNKNFCTINELIEKYKDRKEGTFNYSQIKELKHNMNRNVYKKAFVKIGRAILVNEPEFLRVRENYESKVAKRKAIREEKFEPPRLPQWSNPYLNKLDNGTALKFMRRLKKICLDFECEVGVLDL